MSSPRIRRLQSDHQKLVERFKDWPLVAIAGTKGSPPEEYQIEYRIKSLQVGPGGQIIERHQHLMLVELTLNYPRRAPKCRMLTPLFHPNFDESSVCTGDFWAASEGLDDLIIRVGRMIAYQEYNTKSPLNGLASKWAAENHVSLPVDSREIAPPTLQAAVEAPAVHITSSLDLRLSSHLRPDSLVLHCPRCQTPMQVTDEFVGEPFGCPECQTPLQIAKTEESESLRYQFSPRPTLARGDFTCQACHQLVRLDSPSFNTPVNCPSCGHLHFVSVI